MKKLCLYILILTSFSCQKKKEEVQTNLVISAMTSGQWKVVNYMMGTMDHTNDFSNYRFQFKENYTVDALNNGSLEKTGNWQADAVARTISSQFSNAGPTLTLLNGTWLITDNSWTYVVAKQTIGGQEHSLRLEKQ